jgi:hypothetical protein
MLVVDTPRSAHKKLSILQRFSRKPSSECLKKSDNHTIYNQVVRPASRQQKLVPVSLPTPALSPTPSQSSKKPTTPLSPTPSKLSKKSTPPLSPALSKNDSVLDLPRAPSPHLTKDKKHRKDRTITTQRVDIPQIVRERLAREPSSNSSSKSSSSSSSSSPSSRVQANAIPTKPFPNGPNARVRVTTWDVYLPPTQVHALYLGYLPFDMSDKWFIYSEGPDAMGKLKVHFHRSYTGTKMAELFLVMDVKGEGAGKIVGIKWNGGDDVGSGRMNGDEARYLVRTVVRQVLGFDLEVH